MVSTTAFNLLAFALYCTAFVAVTKRIGRKTAAIDAWVTLPWLGALGLHALGLSQLLPADDGIDLAFLKAASTVAWVVAALSWLYRLRRPLPAISLMVLPIAAVSVVAGGAGDGRATIPDTTGYGIPVHIVVSLLSYGVLSLCGAQAVILYVQNRSLRGIGAKAPLRILPPLDTMEKILFDLLLLGFMLLSVSLITGWVYHQDLLAQHLMHKSFFSSFAWVIFALLLGGHALLGWRGERAVKLALTGLGLLFVGYFGSKFVLEYILQRG